ncbi:hypothetical protein HQN90_07320 [Paenibacillus alba]|nr:hypothetical protein [Paenibacillus alba]
MIVEILILLFWGLLEKLKKDGTVWMWGLDHFNKLVDKPQQVEFRSY